MVIKVFSSRSLLSKTAAAQAAQGISRAIAQQGTARIVAATGASQIDFLDFLTQAPGVDWRQVEMFHLDEYVGLPVEHPASFRKYLLERLIRKTGITNYHLLDGNGNPEEVTRSIGRKLAAAPVDIAFVGIGENGHLAFNDPPADFETEQPYIVVRLDETSRRQQVGEGWFSSLSEVPEQAISMTVRQILKSKEVLCIVPDARKAKAVKACFEGEISPMAPASALRNHPHTTVFLDIPSAHLLSPELISERVL